MKLYSFSTWPLRRSRLLTGAAAVLVLLFSSFNVMAQDDIEDDFLSEMQDEFLSEMGDTVQKESPSMPPPDRIPRDSRPQKVSGENKGLSNIVMSDKTVRAYGWGEYKVMGRCLCCDNSLDGDCILVQNTNRTNRRRIKQIIDGDIEADTSNPKSYFGDVMERDNPKYVTVLVAEITFKQLRDVYEVIVYTMVDKEKQKNYLSNCELGYYDQFDRLQWAGKRESRWDDEYITFQLERPILTKDILLKVRGGRSRITEVTLLGKEGVK